MLLRVTGDELLQRVRHHAGCEDPDGISEIRQILIETEARPDRRLSIAADVPCKANARAEIFQTRVAHDRAVGPRLCGIVKVKEAALPMESLPGHSLKFIAQSQVQRQPGGGFQIILRIESQRFV